MKSSQPERRFFVAAWADPDIATRLLETASPHSHRGRPVSRDRLHLTLAFVGALDPPGLDSTLEALGRVEGQSCLLSVDQLGHWRRSGILWLGCATENSCVADLAEEIRACLRSYHVPVDSRPFRAHITVARQCWRAPHTGGVVPVFWPISTFSLVESTLHSSGSRYRPLENWSLSQ